LSPDDGRIFTKDSVKDEELNGSTHTQDSRQRRSLSLEPSLLFKAALTTWSSYKFIGFI
jgi:hypothetical protein